MHLNARGKIIQKYSTFLGGFLYKILLTKRKKRKSVALYTFSIFLLESVLKTIHLLKNAFQSIFKDIL